MTVLGTVSERDYIYNVAYMTGCDFEKFFIFEKQLKLQAKCAF